MAIPVDEEQRSTWVDVFGSAGSSVLRLSLLFGSIMIALTFLLTPMAEHQSARALQTSMNSGIDRISTGSTLKAARPLAPKYSYTERRSVLQKNKEDVCIIGADGSRTGDC
jgi:hypothetical protein